MDIKKLLEDNKKKYSHNKGKFKCWDCEKEIKGVKIEDFDKESRKNIPLSGDLFYLIICNDCMDNDEEDED